MFQFFGKLVVHRLRVEFVECLENAHVIDIFEKTPDGRKKQPGMDGGLPIEKNGRSIGGDDDIAEIVQIKMDDSGLMDVLEGVEKGVEVGDGNPVFRSGYLWVRFWNFAQGLTGAKRFSHTERTDPASLSRNDAGFFQTEKIMNFAPNQKATDGVSDQKGTAGEILFNEDLSIGGFKPVDFRIGKASLVEERFLDGSVGNRWFHESEAVFCAGAKRGGMTR